MLTCNMNATLTADYCITLAEMKFHERLSTMTICMNTVQGEKGEFRHFDVHSLYGWSESQPTQA